MNRFRMPAEYEPHKGTVIIRPFRPGSFGKDISGAMNAFLNVIEAISLHETVYVLSPEEYYTETEDLLNKRNIRNVKVLSVDSDDSWARDVAPTFVKDENGDLYGISWEFNAWGGDYNGLYSDWKKDNQVAEKCCNMLGIKCIDASPFVLEGGSIHSDGCGTILTTESCLLSKGRNPSLSKEEIEDKLKYFLGAKKILWLPRGIYNDETDEHVDNVCAFISKGKVALAWTDNKDDPQYELSKKCFDYLSKETDASGNPLTIIKIPIPDYPICITSGQLDNYSFEPGEDMREAGERLAASYINFYFCNDAVIVPLFGGKNQYSDERALALYRENIPDREVYGIPAKDILLGGGNIHCITQQIPL